MEHACSICLASVYDYWCTLVGMYDYASVGAREFRARLAEFLERANKGEVIVITRSGRLDAQLGPVAEDAADGDA